MKDSWSNDISKTTTVSFPIWSWHRHTFWLYISYDRVHRNGNYQFSVSFTRTHRKNAEGGAS